MSSVFEFRGSIQINMPIEPIPKCMRKVRDRRGWKNTNVKLTREDLLAICERFDRVGPRHQDGDKPTDALKPDGVAKNGRETWARIAFDFGITRRHVWAIGTGRVWGHVTGRSPSGGKKAVRQ